MTLLDLLLVVAALALGAFHLAQMADVVKGALALRRQQHRDRQALRDAAAGAGALPGISAIVPAPGDGAAARRLVDALTAQRYPDLEVIVVVDSAATSALDAWSARTPLQMTDPRPRGETPTEHVRAIFTAADGDRLLVVDKRGDDRGDALNAGLNVASRPLVLSVAPEARLGEDALVDAALPFALDPDTRVSWTAPTPLDLAATPGGEGADPLVAGVDELRRARRRLESLAASPAAAPAPAPFVMALFQRDSLIRLGGFEPYAAEPEVSLLDRRDAPRPRQPGDVAVRARAPRGWSVLAGDAAPDTPLTRGAALVEAVGWGLIVAGLATGLVAWQTTFFFVSATLGLGLCVSLAALLAEVSDGRATPSLATVAWYALLAAAEQVGPRQFAALTRLRAWASSERAAVTA